MLDKKQCYLQIALNNTLEEAQSIIRQIPLDKRIIIEAGTPLLKMYGVKGIRTIRNLWAQRFLDLSSVNLEIIRPWWLELLIKEKKKEQAVLPFEPYIVADLKCMDRGTREVEIAKYGGANAVTALGHAPIETLDAFIQRCEEYGLDSMIDMMNVEFPLGILRKLKKPPAVVILHRGVDEENFNKEKEIPFHEIQRIKGSYDIIVAVAGGDTFRDVQQAIFNDAEIVIVWKSFFNSNENTAKLAERFLKEFR